MSWMKHRLDRLDAVIKEAECMPHIARKLRAARRLALPQPETQASTNDAHKITLVKKDGSKLIAVVKEVMVQVPTRTGYEEQTYGEPDLEPLRIELAGGAADMPGSKERYIRMLESKFTREELSRLQALCEPSEAGRDVKMKERDPSNDALYAVSDDDELEENVDEDEDNPENYAPLDPCRTANQAPAVEWICPKSKRDVLEKAWLANNKCASLIQLLQAIATVCPKCTPRDVFKAAGLPVRDYFFIATANWKNGKAHSPEIFSSNALFPAATQHMLYRFREEITNDADRQKFASVVTMKWDGYPTIPEFMKLTVGHMIALVGLPQTWRFTPSAARNTAAHWLADSPTVETSRAAGLQCPSSPTTSQPHCRPQVFAALAFIAMQNGWELTMVSLFCSIGISDFGARLEEWEVVCDVLCIHQLSWCLVDSHVGALEGVKDRVINYRVNMGQSSNTKVCAANLGRKTKGAMGAPSKRDATQGAKTTLIMQAITLMYATLAERELTLLVLTPSCPWSSRLTHGWPVWLPYFLRDDALLAVTFLYLFLDPYKAHLWPPMILYECSGPACMEPVQVPTSSEDELITRLCEGLDELPTPFTLMTDKLKACGYHVELARGIKASNYMNATQKESNFILATLKERPDPSKPVEQTKARKKKR